MALHGTWIESNQIQFNSIQTQLKRNAMQMGAQGIENMLVIFIIYDYRVEKKKSIAKT